MSDSSYPIFPIFALVGFILALVPLPWHFQAWNAGTCLYMLWAAVSCLNQFINSIIWHDNALNPAPVWCDICKFANIVCEFYLILCVPKPYELLLGPPLQFPLRRFA